VSYIAVQLFEHAHAGQFQAIPEATAALQTSQYTHLPSIRFLCLLNTTIAKNSSGLTLAARETERFKLLQGSRSALNEAAKKFLSRGRKTGSSGKNGSQSGRKTTKGGRNVTKKAVEEGEDGDEGTDVDY
jgi:hypothetical protein